MNYDAVGYIAVDGQGVGISAAHHTLPVPSYVEVTSLTSGRTILVRVDRRGPMDSNRVISLSQGAAAQLGVGDHDTVRVRRVNPPEPERASLRAGGSAPERMATPQPLLVVLSRRLGPDEPVLLTTAMPAVHAPTAAVMVPPSPSPVPRMAVAVPMAPTPAYTARPQPVQASGQTQTYVSVPVAAASDLAPMPPESGASYVPSAQHYSPPPAVTRQPVPPAPAYVPPVTQAATAYAPAPQQYAPAPPPEEQGALATDATQPPVPFRSYLIRPLRRASDGSVIMPGTNAPAYPTPAFPTANGTERVDPNGAVYAYGPPTQPSTMRAATQQRQTDPQRSYLIQPLSRSGSGMIGGTVVQPETMNSAGSHAGQFHGYARSAAHGASKHTSTKLAHAKAGSAKHAPVKHPLPKLASGDQEAATAEQPQKPAMRDDAVKPEGKAASRAAHHKTKPEETSLATPASAAPLAALATTSSETLVVQAGAYSVRGRAEQVAQSVGGVVSLSGRAWRVRCGPFASRAGAEAVLAKVKAAGYSEARIQRAD